MKNYKQFNIGDRVEILFSGPKNNSKGQQGVITEVRNSFCKILLDGHSVTQNHCYGRFKRICTP